MGKRFYLSYLEIKEKKERNPYDGERCYPCDGNFWNFEQKEMFDGIYNTLNVFQHKYVKCGDISDVGNVLSTKFGNLGLKDLISYSSSWVWSEDIIKQFYGTLFINSKCTQIEFMIGSEHYEATKKDLEDALGINPGDKNITALHSLPKWKENNSDALSLYVVPTTSNKEVRHLKPKVDLIQKISRYTLLPRTGSRDKCSNLLLKLAHTIYHGKHFDVAYFLLREMRIAIETPDRALPYVHYIFCFLSDRKIIPKEIVGKTCSVVEYQPKVMEQTFILKSIAARIVELSKKVDKCSEKYVKRFETLENGLQKFEKLKEEDSKRQRAVEMRFEKPFYCRAYERRRQTDS